MPPTGKASNNSHIAPAGTRSIRDFFTPFTIPKHHIPANDVIEDEIVVAPARGSESKSAVDGRLTARTPVAGPRIKGRDALTSERSLDGTSETASSSHETLSARVSSRELDGTVEHKEPVRSSIRRMVAVEIESPHKARQLSDPESRPIPPISPLDSVPRPSSQKGAVMTSFSSISTLSSVPRSSQSSSRRIIKDGWQAVTNSDSGSGDGDEDSGDELLDLADFVPRVAKRRKVSPIPEEAPVESLVNRRGQRPRRHVTPPTPPRPVYKHSLAALARQAQRRESVEAKLAAAEEAFGAAQRLREEDAARSKDLDAGLQLTLADDSDEGQRMKLAMQRTEALLEEERFFYFRSLVRIDRLPKPEDLPFKWLSEPQKWEQACLSGFLAEMVGRKLLSPDACRWMLAELLNDDVSDELCAAYVDVLCQCCKRGLYRALRSLKDCYAVADMDSRLSTSARNAMEADSKSAMDQVAPKLRYVLRVLEASCRSALPDEAALCIVELVLANIDEHVKADAALRVDVQETLEAIMTGRSDDDFALLSVHVAERFRELTTLKLEMQCRAIAALPATTIRSHEIRRRLALQLIGNGRSRQTKHAGAAGSALPQLSACWNALEDFDILLHALKGNSRFAVSEHTDYSLLASLTAVLDIAIDSGFGRPSPSGTSSRTLSSDPPSIAAPPPHGPFWTTTMTTQAPTPAERAFNSATDSLAAHLRSLASRVRDAGAAHLRRTEAKTALERLAARLECGVRTRPRARAAVFGRGLAPQRALMAGFIGGAEAGRVKGNDVAKGNADQDVEDDEGDGNVEVDGTAS